MKKIMLSLGIAFMGITTYKISTNESFARHKAPLMAAVKAEAIELTDADFYKALLQGLGAKVTEEKIKFLEAWRQGEGGQAKNNPFNTTKGVAGATKYNSAGVRNYPDRVTGLYATIHTLNLSYYKDIVNLLRKDEVTAKELAHCRSLKKWGTGNRVKKVLALGNVNPPAIAA